MFLARIFHELSLLKMQGRGRFAVVVYAKWPITGKRLKGDSEKVQQDRLAQRVKSYASKRYKELWYKLYPVNMGELVFKTTKNRLL